MTIFDWYTSFIRLFGISIATFFLLWIYNTNSWLKTDQHNNILNHPILNGNGGIQSLTIPRWDTSWGAWWKRPWMLEWQSLWEINCGLLGNRWCGLRWDEIFLKSEGDGEAMDGTKQWQWQWKQCQGLRKMRHQSQWRCNWTKSQ